MSVDLSRTRLGATFVFALFLAALAAFAACQDVSDLLTLRDEVRDHLGYEKIEVGVRYPEHRVVMTLQDPGPEAAAPDRGTARTAAVLARRAYARARDSDSIDVVFEESREDGGLVSTVTRRSFTFAASALGEEPD